MKMVFSFWPGLNFRLEGVLPIDRSQRISSRVQ